MEVAGLVCGAIPLIVMTFQGYRLIRNFETEYNSLNPKLRSVLRDISTEGSLFKYVFNEILAETVAEDERKLMLGNPRSEYWASQNLQEDIELVLGDLFLPMVQSVAAVQETLQEIKTLLLLLSGNKIPSKSKSIVKQPLKRVAMNVAAIATSVLHNDPLGLHFKNIQIQSTAKKLITLAKDHRGALEVLRNQLRDHNRTLRAILNFRSNPRSGLRVKIPPMVREVSTYTTETGPSTTGKVPIRDQDARIVQKTSEKLHRMVSSALSCNCHTVHLCLEHQPNGKDIDRKGKSRQSLSTESGAKFSFRLSASSGLRLSIASHQAIHLVFTSRGPRPNDVVTPPASALPASTFCALAQSDGFESYLHDTDGSSTDGFLLQRVTAPTGWAKFSNSISLEDLVVSRATELRSLDRFLIATKLAYSVVQFYRSPWVRDWSLHTIHFFEKYEQSGSTPGRWTPHLALTPNSPGAHQLGDRNREIYLLGIMLLQLGRRKRVELSDLEKEQLTYHRALGELCQEMGLRYKTFVQNCLVLWSDRNTDLMGTGNLALFLSHIRVLEDGARDFLSE